MLVRCAFEDCQALVSEHPDDTPNSRPLQLSEEIRLPLCEDCANIVACPGKYQLFYVGGERRVKRYEAPIEARLPQCGPSGSFPEMGYDW